MRTLADHIERIKGKPHHVRRRAAFGAAALGTALVAFAWLAASFSTGAFALHATSFAESTGQEGARAPAGAAENLAGAAAALPSDARAPARIEIIDAATSSGPAASAPQTVIPF